MVLGLSRVFRHYLFFPCFGLLNSIRIKIPIGSLHNPFRHLAILSNDRIHTILQLKLEGLIHSHFVSRGVYYRGSLSTMEIELNIDTVQITHNLQTKSNSNYFAAVLQNIRFVEVFLKVLLLKLNSHLLHTTSYMSNLVIVD